MERLSHAYSLAQRSISDLKTAIHLVLCEYKEGLSNAELGRLLGIYHGHSGKHEGHISRALLELMLSEGIVEQNEKTKKWSLKKISADND